MGRMILTREIGVLEGNLLQLSIFPPKIPQRINWDQTHASVLKGGD